MQFTIKLVGYDSKGLDIRGRQKPRVYFWPEGENVLENLANRTTRPHKEYRKLLPDVLLAAQAQVVGSDLSAAKASWSKHAGCRMCPCSPGFVLDGARGFPFDIHVTVGPGLATTGAPEADDRRAQIGLEPLSAGLERALGETF